MTKITIKKYDQIYKHQLIKFLGFFYDSLNYEERDELFYWRYESNPYTKTPFIYLAFDNDEIIGCRAFVIQKFKVENKEFLLGDPADAIVHPQYRRKGIYSKLTKFAIHDMNENSDVQFLVSLSANSASEAGNLKLGFVPIGAKKYIFHVSLLNALKTFFRDDIHLNNSFVSSKNDVEIEITNELRIKEISDLMNNFLDKKKITKTKDKGFYKWIFFNTPHEYYYGYCKKNGELVSYVCLEKKTRLFYSLVEYGYTKPEFLEQLLKICYKKLNIPLLRLYAFTKNQDEILMFNNFGFRGEEDYLMSMLKKFKLLTIEDGAGMLIKPISEDKNENFFIGDIDTRIATNWFLFSLDIH